MTEAEHLDRYPNTDRTRAIADAMDVAYDAYLEPGHEIGKAPVPHVQMEIYGVLGQLAHDVGPDYINDPLARRRLAFLIEPSIAEEFEFHMEKRRSLEREMEVDPMTGLGNGRALERAKHRANSHRDLLFVMFDGDNFGQVNKVHNHIAGNKPIIDLAQHLRTVAEAHGVGTRVFRLHEGGDEFAIISPRSKADSILFESVQGFGQPQYGDVKVGVTGAIGDTDEQAIEILRDMKARRNQGRVGRRVLKVLGRRTGP